MKTQGKSPVSVSFFHSSLAQSLLHLFFNLSIILAHAFFYQPTYIFYLPTLRVLSFTRIFFTLLVRAFTVSPYIIFTSLFQALCCLLVRINISYFLLIPTPRDKGQGVGDLIGSVARPPNRSRHQSFALKKDLKGRLKNGIPADNMVANADPEGSSILRGISSLPPFFLDSGFSRQALRKDARTPRGARTHVGVILLFKLCSSLLRGLSL